MSTRTYAEHEVRHGGWPARLSGGHSAASRRSRIASQAGAGHSTRSDPIRDRLAGSAAPQRVPSASQSQSTRTVRFPSNPLYNV